MANAGIHAAKFWHNIYLLFASRLVRGLTRAPSPLRECLNPGAADFRPLSINDAIHPSGDRVLPIEEAKFLMAVTKPKREGLDLNIEYVKSYSKFGYVIR